MSARSWARSGPGNGVGSANATARSASPGRASTPAPVSSNVATSMKPRSRSGPCMIEAARACPSAQPGSSVSYGRPSMTASISARRWRSNASVSANNGSTVFGRQHRATSVPWPWVVEWHVAQHRSQGRGVDHADRDAAADRRIRARPRVARAAGPVTTGVPSTT